MQVLAVPVKPLDSAKTRLSPLLDPAERARLTLAMLRDVLAEACRVDDWDVWVVSRDPEVLAVGLEAGALPLVETGRSLLEAVRDAERLVRGARPALGVLLADVPFVSADELALVLRRRAAVVAAAARSDGGTNLLVRRPPTAIPARFGRQSFARHRHAAAAAGVRFEAVRAPSLARDVDRPHDLAPLFEPGPEAPHTRAVCRALGLAERLRVRA